MPSIQRFVSRLPLREVLLALALVAGGATLLGWLAAGADAATAVARALSALLVVSPFAPAVAQRIAQNRLDGLLDDLKVHDLDDATLDALATADVVVFDTASTLTAGTPVVSAVLASPRSNAAEVLSLAASAEFESSHPLARAIIHEARSRAVAVAPPTGFTTIEGRGVRSTVEGREVLVGSSRLVAEQGIVLEPSLATAAHLSATSGASVLFVLEASQVCGVIAITDEIRSGAPESVSRLRAEGLRVAMLTGAPLEVADWLSVRLGLTEVFAAVLPRDKPDVISRMQTRGSRVVVVGDGIDDAATLAQADVGIALGADAGHAKVLIAARDPRRVADLVAAARVRWRGARRRLGILIAFHALTVPIAAGALAGLGVVMPPVLAVALSLALLGGLAADAHTQYRRIRP